MVETLPLFPTSFNSSIESRPYHLTGDAASQLQREITEYTGIIGNGLQHAWMIHETRGWSHTPPDDLQRTHLLIPGQGWQDQNDEDRARQNSSLPFPKDASGMTRRCIGSSCWPGSSGSPYW